MGLCHTAAERWSQFPRLESGLTFCHPVMLQDFGAWVRKAILPGPPETCILEEASSHEKFWLC